MKKLKQTKMFVEMLKRNFAYAKKNEIVKDKFVRVINACVREELGLNAKARINWSTKKVTIQDSVRKFIL